MKQSITERFFHLQTKNASYIMYVNDFGHLEHLYFGSKVAFKDKISKSDIDNFRKPLTTSRGTTVTYDEKKDPFYSLDWANFELGTVGKGDFRSPSLLLKSKNGHVSDFVFESVSIEMPNLKNEPLPYPANPDSALTITMKDKISGATIHLRYLIYVESDVIARDIVIENGPYILEKALSFNVDFPQQKYQLFSTYGAWVSEAHLAKQTLMPGVFSVKTQAGPSSNRHNPLTILKVGEGDLDHGLYYGFNLLYSGPFEMNFETTPDNRLRVNGGINSTMFSADMSERKEPFVTPWVVMTFTKRGQNGIAQNFHNFVNNHIIRGDYKKKVRPVLINNWEGTYFNFNERKIKAMINKASKLGFELFVLDDGWFTNRDNDLGGLGNYEVNFKKLPNGLDGLADYANKKGMMFGLWFEPEMVSEDSDLFRAMPHWAIQVNNVEPSKSRHQLALDLTKKEVQDYIIQNVQHTLDSANIGYVKWDYNRPLSDFGCSLKDAGTYFYDYTLGLYRILKILTEKNPHILWEGCASGGNRFDLGVLCYFAQIWASDCSDAIERVRIQSTLALGYPLSTIGAHVSHSPNQQTLREASLATRFSMALLGTLGYELDITKLTPIEVKEIKEQIKFYKQHRELILGGNYYELKIDSFYNKRGFCIVNAAKTASIVVIVNLFGSVMPRSFLMPQLPLLCDKHYKITSNKQYTHLSRFDALLKFVLPSFIKYDGPTIRFLNKRKTAEDLVKLPVIENYEVDGTLLCDGKLALYHEWCGTGVSEQTKILGDFGGVYYYIEAVE